MLKKASTAQNNTEGMTTLKYLEFWLKCNAVMM